MEADHHKAHPPTRTAKITTTKICFQLVWVFFRRAILFYYNLIICKIEAREELSGLITAGPERCSNLFYEDKGVF